MQQKDIVLKDATMFAQCPATHQSTAHASLGTISTNKGSLLVNVHPIHVNISWAVAMSSLRPSGLRSNLRRGAAVTV